MRLERNYRSTGHILAAASHLIAHNEGRLGKTLFTDGERRRKADASPASGTARRKRAPSARRSSNCSARAIRLEEIAILVRASFQMREFEERFITLGLPYRVIGGPRFYERAEIRDALAYLRCVAQPADDLAFERIVNTPKRGLGDATLQMLHEYARRERIPLMQAARVLVETEELKPKPRATLRALLARFRALARPDRHEAASRTRRDWCWTNPAIPRCGGRTRRRKRPGGSKTSRNSCARWRQFPDLAGFLEHVSLVMETDEAAGAAARVDHDAARRQGAGIRDRLSARLGGRAVSASALARRERPRRARGRAPPRLCRHHARQAAREDFLRHQPAHPRPVADDDALALHRQSAGGACRGGRGGGRLAIWRLWRVALRQYGQLWLELFDARLEARADARERSGAPRGAAQAPRGQAPRSSRAKCWRNRLRTSRFSPGARVFHLKFGPGTVASCRRQQAARSISTRPAARW